MGRVAPELLQNRWPGRIRRRPAGSALDPAPLLVDGRSEAELLAMAPEMAPLLAFHDLRGKADKDWQRFFQYDILFLLAQIGTCDQAGLERDLRALEAATPIDERKLAERIAAMTSMTGQWRDRAAGCAADYADGADVVQFLEHLFGFAPPPSEEPLNTARRLVDDIRRTRARALDYLQTRMTNHPDHAPHAALYAAFLRMQRYLRDDLNTFSQRHLDHYYNTVLRLKARDAEPDSAVVSLALIPKVERLELPAATLLVAGKDSAGEDVLYETGEALVLNQAELASIKTLYIQREPGAANDNKRWVERIYVNQRADTEDGIAAPLKDPLRGWPTFGARRPLGPADAMSDIGLVAVSPLLSLGEGRRDVTLNLKVESVSFNDLLRSLKVRLARAGSPLADAPLQALYDGCQLHLSGAKDWRPVEKFDFTLVPAPGELDYLLLKLHFILQPDAPACVANRDLPPRQPAGALPMLRLMIKPSADVYLYSFFRQLSVEFMTLDVKVFGLRQLQIQGPAGPLPPNKPFAPFGPVPQYGDTFQIAHPELRDKQVSVATLHLAWRDMLQGTASLAVYYQNYGKPFPFADAEFKAGFAVYSGYDWVPVPASPDSPTQPLFGTAYHASDFRLAMPPLAPPPRTPAASLPPRGTLAVTLAGPSYAFGHQQFPKAYADVMMQNMRSALRWWRKPEPLTINQPLTPVLDGVSLDYEASGAVSTCFFVGPFGYCESADNLRREWQSEQRDEGHLYLGFRAAQQPEELNLHFELREKSAAAYPNDKNDAQHPISWRYLRGDSWIDIPGDMVLTRTDDFRRSGIVRLRLPRDIDASHNLMPAELYWVQARVADGAALVNRTVRILTGAVQVQRCAPVHRPGVPIRLPANSIVALVKKLPQIKSIEQPFASIGGTAAETVDAYRVRVAQRLRHKQRASQPADFEELALTLFPSLWQAKCSTANNSKAYFSDPELKGGELTLTILEPVRTGQPVPLVPLPLYFLQEVQQRLREHASPFVNKITVRNPLIEFIKVYVTVKFMPGCDNAYSTMRLNLAINQLLAPWLFDDQRAVDLGSRMIQVHKVAAAIRREPYVDDIGSVSVLHRFDNERDGDSHWIGESGAVLPTLPWSVLLPESVHGITIGDDGSAVQPGIGIGVMAVQQDFHLQADVRDVFAPAGDGGV